MFIEVRFWARPRASAPRRETVDIHKQRRLAAAATHYLRCHPTKLPCRFDVIVVSGSNCIDWIRNAFNVE